jgi:hypothetical protein
MAKISSSFISTSSTFVVVVMVAFSFQLVVGGVDGGSNQISSPNKDNDAMLAKIIEAISSRMNNNEPQSASTDNESSEENYDSDEYYNKRGIPFSGGVYGKRGNIPFSGGMYGKRAVPFSGGMYGKRAVPFSGGMYGKKSVPFSGGVYGKRSSSTHTGGKKSIPFSGGLYG